MLFSSSTWLVVVLLASVAMLGSYLLSHGSILRTSGRTLAWTGLSAGTLLLLAAAALVSLSMYSMATLHLSWPEALAGYFIKPAQPDPDAGFQAHATDVYAAPATQNAASRAAERANARNRSGANAVEVANRTASQALVQSISKVGDALPVARIATPAATTDLWAATACVGLMHRDPANPPRTAVINNCTGPVVVVFQSCPQSDCSTMVLPGSAQRSVVDGYETRYGMNIRYVACQVTLPAAIDLIGMPSEQRDSDAWRAAFAAARHQDHCLLAQ